VEPGVVEVVVVRSHAASETSDRQAPTLRVYFNLSSPGERP
jgi:hypothetical protein